MTSAVAKPSNTAWILGLTGGIGSGKSAAAQCFAELGVHTVDVDHAARWVVEPGQPALAHIAEHFGQQVVREDGQLNRGVLRTLIFQDPQQRQWLEALLHPLIRQAAFAALAKGTSPYGILVSPLLIESEQYKLVQRVLVVDVPEALQIQRTLQRDHSNAAQVQAILAAQASRATRLEHADDVLVNDRDMAWLRSEVARLHALYLTLNLKTGGQP